MRSAAREKSVRNHTPAMVLLVISALWPQNNVKPYVNHTGSVRCPFGYSTGRADAVRAWEHHMISRAG